MTYKIASFNLLDFNLKSNDESKKDFEKISKIVLGEKIDVIGIQEVLSEMAIKLLVMKLNNNRSAFQDWKYECLFPINRNASKQEGYAFIWNDKKLNLLEIENKENPRIINDFKIKNEPGQTMLVRNPCFIRFVPKNRSFEIRLINTHIRFSKSNLDSLVAASENQMRLNEFNLLASTILPKCTDIRTGQNMPAYTFLLGDYNINLNRPENGYPYLREDILTVNDRGRNRTIQTIQDKKTSLKAVNEGEEIPAEIYANNYDHFSFDVDKSGHVIKGGADRIEAVTLYEGGDLVRYRKEISDHVPIFINISA